MKSVPPPLPILNCIRCQRRPATRGSYCHECDSVLRDEALPRRPWASRTNELLGGSGR